MMSRIHKMNMTYEYELHAFVHICVYDEESYIIADDINTTTQNELCAYMTQTIWTKY